MKRHSDLTLSQRVYFEKANRSDDTPDENGLNYYQREMLRFVAEYWLDHTYLLVKADKYQQEGNTSLYDEYRKRAEMLREYADMEWQGLVRSLWVAGLNDCFAQLEEDQRSAALRGVDWLDSLQADIQYDSWHNAISVKDF